ncbi:cytochrome b/b6 domain-containing protein [uncultured Photobacterium sp.]|uniref:cytochrome b n=1 Tax=uncultured Photobacterium sp. TaxID=173973 RepID=UPI002618C74C|nr:cytochrome b/b6 domain-containing protein [uncultured Photobacterium sp.]
MKRYHPILVILHWLLAVMIILGLIMGGNVLSATSNTEPQRLFYLKMHMLTGIIILVLMLVRLVVRFVTVKPSYADIGNTLFNKLGVAIHYLFYLIVILMAGSGLAIASMAGLFEIVFTGSGAPLPETFNEFPPRMAHSILGGILTLLIAGHILAFIYHQFIRKDGLFSRMWFGLRKE